MQSSTAYTSGVMKRDWPESALLGLGLLLRVLMPLTFSVQWGFDFWGHEHYVRWFAHSWAPPPPNLSVEVFHPPLFYWLAGGLLRLGLPLQAVACLSALSGCIRLLLIWRGLRLVFPQRPLVRQVSLALAAIIPSALHIDGMLNAEALHSALTAGALLALMMGVGAQGWRKWLYAIVAGILTGLALLAKVSAVVIVATLALTTVLEALRGMRRALPWLAGLAMTLLLAFPHYRENKRQWDTWLPNSFTTTQLAVFYRVINVPVSKRRPLNFYLGWTPSYFVYPFAPEDKQAQARFFPTMVASTFVDHYASFFVWPPPTSEKPLHVNFRLMPASALWPARLSFLGGTILFLTVVPAFVVALWLALKRRNTIWLAGLAASALAIFAQLRFAVHYPLDDYGVIKANYVQFAAAPLYALIGVAVDWLCARRQRTLASVILISIGMVALYTLFARTVALSSISTSIWR
jgi:4-amino-4-deoxy-L-arabinose transferase-like glycosyltransferase